MTIEQIRLVLQRFQDGYTQRDLSRVDEVMALFAWAQAQAPNV